MFGIKKQIESLYEILNIPENATRLEIKKAYKKLAILYHPDKVASIDDPELKARAENELIKLNNAKEILLDPEKREKYDSKLELLRAKDELTEFEIFEIMGEVEEIEDFEVDWESTSAPEDAQNEEHAQVIINYDPSRFYSQPPIPQPPSTLPDFAYIQRRFLTFCPNCGEENIQGRAYCVICNKCLIYPPPPPFPGANPPQYIPYENYKPQPNSVQYTTTGTDYEAEPYPEKEPIYIRKPPAREFRLCPNCGAKNYPDSEYCNKCNSRILIYANRIDRSRNSRRTPFSPYSTPPPSNLNNTFEPSATFKLENDRIQICPECGAANLHDSEFCRNCDLNLRYYNEIKRRKESKPGQGIGDEPGSKKYNMQECPHCGTENPIGNSYCDSCYKNLEFREKSINYETPTERNTREVEVRSFVPKRCSNCGHMVYPGQDVCQNCGSKFYFYETSE